MALKLYIKSLEEVPEAFRSAYKEKKDGSGNADGFVLDVEGGVVEKSKLDEFREKNIELQQKLADASGADKNLVAEKDKKIKELEEEVARRIAPEDKDKDFEEQIKPLKASWEEKETKFNTDIAELNSQIERLKVDDKLKDIAIKNGVREDAITDALARAKNVFKLEEGKVVAKTDADKIWIDTDTAEPLTMEGWIKKVLAKDASFLFKGSNGGGADGNDEAGSGGSGINPFKKENQNLTEIGKIYRDDPAKAKRLCLEAGRSPAEFGLK